MSEYFYLRLMVLVNNQVRAKLRKIVSVIGTPGLVRNAAGLSSCRVFWTWFSVILLGFPLIVTVLRFLPTVIQADIPWSHLLMQERWGNDLRRHSRDRSSPKLHFMISFVCIQQSCLDGRSRSWIFIIIQITALWLSNVFDDDDEKPDFRNLVCS